MYDPSVSLVWFLLILTFPDFGIFQKECSKSKSPLKLKANSFFELGNSKNTFYFNTRVSIKINYSSLLNCKYIYENPTCKVTCVLGMGKKPNLSERRFYAKKKHRTSLMKLQKRCFLMSQQKQHSYIMEWDYLGEIIDVENVSFLSSNC